MQFFAWADNLMNSTIGRVWNLQYGGGGYLLLVVCIQLAGVGLVLVCEFHWLLHSLSSLNCKTFCPMQNLMIIGQFFDTTWTDRPKLNIPAPHEMNKSFVKSDFVYCISQQKKVKKLCFSDKNKQNKNSNGSGIIFSTRCRITQTEGKLIQKYPRVLPYYSSSPNIMR